MAEKLSPLTQELLNRADSIFSKIAEAASKAGDFAAEQLPDIAYQFVAYNRAYMTALMVLSIVMFITAIFVVRKFWKASEGAIIFPGALTVIVSFMMFTTNLKEFLMVWFAPKIFIITEIVKLVK